jgi:NAD(P)-dependent dehydrogenase (short-subunit alcohol dehydrogenase family)
MVSKLAGKTALVTGASRGIGQAIACRLAADGAEVIVHYGRSEEGARKTVALIESGGGRASIVHADLSRPAEQAQTMFAELDGRLGGKDAPYLDILVNNAGHLLQATLEETSESEFDAAIAVDFKAPFFVTKAASSRMRSGGRIINISSGIGRIATPGAVACSAAKGALNTLTKSLALHFGGRSITVNAVAPGLTATADLLKLMADTPEFLEAGAAQPALGRLGEPADIANIVAFVASDDSAWITGQVLDATGGAALN